ncbi:hypothetical protein SAY86_024370 [Trapa natans]|uniref:Epidermal patterning factor-like protein n=1 Tax=Trapa natans TaxID=22666 RepID=A0AAN7M497_TRANT|nr:hypothetical protein SAY86_024370 [Trapa natans]
MRLLFSRTVACIFKSGAFTILFILAFLTNSSSLSVSAKVNLNKFTYAGRAAMVSSGPSKGEAGWEVVIARVQRIGSTPPICNRKCNSCGPCEAIQVPMNPQEMELWLGRKGSSSSLVVGEYYSRDGGYDEGSNYKPMSWKCKCGKIIFNP